MTAQWRNYSGNPSENLWHHWSNNLKKISSQKLCNRVLTITHLIIIFLKVFRPVMIQIFKGYPNNFSAKLSSQIFKCYARNFLIHEERIGNVVITTNWITPVQLLIAKTWCCIFLVIKEECCSDCRVCAADWVHFLAIEDCSFCK